MIILNGPLIFRRKKKSSEMFCLRIPIIEYEPVLTLQADPHHTTCKLVLITTKNTTLCLLCTIYNVLLRLEVEAWFHRAACLPALGYQPKYHDICTICDWYPACFLLSRMLLSNIYCWSSSVKLGHHLTITKKNTTLVKK